MKNQENEKTNLENVEQYKSWKQEWEGLQSMDCSEDWESIQARIAALQADILSYEQCHAIISASGAHTDMDYATYWNTIALEHDFQNGDM